MKKSRYSGTQIVRILKEVEGGNTMKLLVATTALLLATLSDSTHAQSLEEAVEFIYCGDAGWDNCVFSGEIANCSVELETIKFNDGVINDSLNYKIHFNNFIWRSATSNTFLKQFNVSCADDCVEDLKGNLADYYLLVLGLFLDTKSYALGFTAAANRVIAALNVVQNSCPGVSSSF